MLNILVIVDINGFFPQNPFISDYVKSLSRELECRVYVGKHWLSSTEISWDIVNIHWPEYLLAGQNDLIEFSWLNTRLSLLAKTSRIITTIHNLRPHSKKLKSISSNDIFKLVYHYSCAFIHLAEASIPLLIDQYPKETANKIHHVIPHGNYLSFENEASNSTDYRPSFQAYNDKIRVLSIGAIRSLTELRFLFSACTRTLEMDGEFINCSTLNFDITIVRPILLSKIFNRFFDEVKVLLIKKFFPIVTGVPFEGNFIPASKMSELLTSCNVVFLPRASSLNSGNIPLAFTYGCVVVGPDIGNIGLILRQSGNPVYTITNSNVSIRSAIDKCFDISAVGILSEKNKDTALRKWDWSAIAKDYISFFSKVANTI